MSLPRDGRATAFLCGLLRPLHRRETSRRQALKRSCARVTPPSHWVTSTTLSNSLAPESRYDFDRKAITHWSRSSQWLGLEILSTEQGLQGDETGYVEFVAHFSSEGERYAHRERSLFRHDVQDGRWYFLEEANRKSAPVVKGKQAGRNDPCPCGSGKKFKKCCGAAA